MRLARLEDVLRAALADHLQSQTLLLVLDNCEHLIEASVQLARALLERCAGVRILATSRQPLGITGEVRWRVPPLAVPARVDGGCEAAQLFIERAREVRPDLEFSSEDAQVIAGICCRLEGIPLAIELAAARLSALTVERPAARLPRALDAAPSAVSGRQAQAARQETLRATLDWSYQLLTEEQRMLLRRLSVFSGGWTLEAAEQVCSGGSHRAGSDYWRHGVMGSGQEEPSGSSYAITASLANGHPDRRSTASVLELLTALVDKSLVIFEERRGSGAGGRYRMLETVRQYARERLAARGESGEVSRRHRDFLIHLAGGTRPPGSEEVAVLERLADELANLRAALAWSLDHDSAGGLQLLIQTYPFWIWRDHLAEGSEWLQRLLACRPAPPPELRARALWAFASFTEWQGNLAGARELYEQALVVARQCGDRSAAASALLALGQLASRRGADREAVPLLEESIRTSEAVGMVSDSLRGRSLLGLAVWRLGETVRGLSLLDESLALARIAGDCRSAIFALDTLGDPALERGDFPAAREFHGEKLAVARSAGNDEPTTHALTDLARIAWEEGEYPAARARYEEALEVARRYGSTALQTLCLNQMACLAHAEGDPERARSAAVESLRLAAGARQPERAAGALRALAGVAASGEPERAARLLGAAERLQEPAGTIHSAIERRLLETVTASTLAALGAAPLAAANAAGRALSLEQAVEYALAFAALDGS